MHLNKGMQNVIKVKEEVSARYKTSEKKLKFEGCLERFQNEVERVERHR